MRGINREKPSERIGEARVFETEEAWVEAAAAHFMECGQKAISARGLFSVVLPGGSTPRLVYERLARWIPSKEFWLKTQVYFGDERCVPPSDPESNFRSAMDTLLAHVPIPTARIHRMESELGAKIAAERYNQTLILWLGTQSEPRNPFDLVILGLGTDGHVASLIPGVALNYLANPWMAVGAAPASPARVERVTMNAAALRNCREMVFWIRGRAKAEVVRVAVDGQPERTMVPRVVPPNGVTTWILDTEAARLL